MWTFAYQCLISSHFMRWGNILHHQEWFCPYLCVSSAAFSHFHLNFSSILNYHIPNWIMIFHFFPAENSINSITIIVIINKNPEWGPHLPPPVGLHRAGFGRRQSSRRPPCLLTPTSQRVHGASGHHDNEQMNNGEVRKMEECSSAYTVERGGTRNMMVVKGVKDGWGWWWNRTLPSVVSEGDSALSLCTHRLSPWTYCPASGLASLGNEGSKMGKGLLSGLDLLERPSRSMMPWRVMYGSVVLIHPGTF